MKQTNKMIADEVLSHSKFNPFSVRKPWSFNWMYILLLPNLYILFLVADKFTENQITVVGILGSTITAFLILFVTVNQQKRLEYLTARKSANILSNILDSVFQQIDIIDKGSRNIIFYPTNWLDYYYNCSIYLKYDYLKCIMKEFNYVEQINNCLLNSDETKLKNLILSRRKWITTSIHDDFNIIFISSNLSTFSINSIELIPWKKQKPFKQFLKFFDENYTDKVKEITIKYLEQQKAGSCDENDAMNYVMIELKKDENFKANNFKFIQDKEILYAIFKVYLTLTENDRFTLVWGSLTLKNAHISAHTF